MTLLIAEVSSTWIWMVADTAVTGGAIGLRDKVNIPKIVPGQGRSLIGFSGDSHYGARIIQQASKLPVGSAALDFLFRSHVEIGSVDFAYAFYSENQPRLVLISNGRASDVQVLHLGDTDAFASFQVNRHNQELTHAPKALHTFLCGVEGPEKIPKRLSDATCALLLTIFDGKDRNVGGWAVPYLLTDEGVRICTYVYSVTDAVIDNVPMGTAIPHGTAEAGGFGLSFSGLVEKDGMVAYWLQRPGGCVTWVSENGYEQKTFSGLPASFKSQVNSVLGRNVHVWFGDAPISTATSASMLTDSLGRPRLTVAQDEQSLSFAWVQNTEESFMSDGIIDLRGANNKMKDELAVSPVEVSLSNDLKTIELALTNENSLEKRITLDITQVEKLIFQLAAARESMSEPVADEIESGTKLLCVVDPAWRTKLYPHPSIVGPVLSLRHPGFGWLSFILPFNEADALGRWLVDCAKHLSDPTST
jgi:hypothetical protein